MPVKIIGIKTWLLAIDAGPWYGDAPIPKGEVPIWHYPLTQISTVEGVDGYTMGYGTNGEGRGSAYLLHDVYWHALEGEDPLRHEALWQRLKSMNRHLYALADGLMGMLDVAFWDIKGKVAGMSIGTLLGICREKVPSYSTGSHYNLTPQQVFDEATSQKEAGYRGYKLSLWDGPARDIPRLRAAREAVGQDFPLMLDGVSGYRFTQALEVGRALDELNYHWFEEPIPDRQIGLLKQLNQELAVPILAGETVRLSELAEYLRQHAVDQARGDVFIKGGITGLRKAAAMCELFGLNLEIHTMTAPLLDVANLHVACSIDNCEFLESHHPMFRFGLKDQPLEIDSQGYLHLPKGPGLGVELDWDWVENHTVEVISKAAK